MGLVLVRDGVAVWQSGCVCVSLPASTIYIPTQLRHISVMTLCGAEECYCTVLCVG